MPKITEDEFYALCDRIDEVDVDVTEGYFPTIDDLVRHGANEKMKVNERYLKLLIYYSTDPLSRFGYKTAESSEYKEMVKYVRDMISNMELT